MNQSNSYFLFIEHFNIMLKLYGFVLFISCVFANDYKLDRRDPEVGKFLALPLVIGFLVGLSLVVCGFGLWVKAEGFHVCSRTRAEQEKEYAVAFKTATKNQAQSLNESEKV